MLFECHKIINTTQLSLVNQINTDPFFAKAIFDATMLIFRIKQKLISDMNKLPSNAIGLSKKFFKWYLEEWKKKNLLELSL